MQYIHELIHVQKTSVRRMWQRKLTMHIKAFFLHLAPGLQKYAHLLATTELTETSGEYIFSICLNEW
jgi:hypothetical protein